jgi:ParB family chromosome partitioning protein
MIEDESMHLIADDDQFAHSFTVNVSAIEADPDQPRRHFDQASLEDMAASFKTVGLLQPVLLRKHPKIRRRWIIVAGERRWRAAKLAGWTEITAIETVANMAEATLIENIQRSDLTVMEEGRALQKMMQTHFWTQERCATTLGIDAPRVSAALNVLTLPNAFLADVTSGAVSVPRNVLVELARIKEAPLRDKMIALAREGDLTIRLLRAGRKEAGAGETPADAPVRHAKEPASLKQARLKQLLAALNAVSAADYHPSADEIDKLSEVKTAIDRIIAAHDTGIPEDIGQLELL